MVLRGSTKVEWGDEIIPDTSELVLGATFTLLVNDQRQEQWRVDAVHEYDVWLSRETDNPGLRAYIHVYLLSQPPRLVQDIEHLPAPPGSGVDKAP